jgi:hypothetical protein
MPITCGSVSDIIAICVLVKDCVEALSDANGSVSQYEAVIRELQMLEKALLEVGLLNRSHASKQRSNDTANIWGPLQSTPVFKRW